jgi:hypothetical protein
VNQSASLLTLSRNSGPRARRARPDRQQKPKKVRFLTLMFFAKTKHNTCAAVVKPSTSFAPEFRSRARRQLATSTCLQLAGRQELRHGTENGRESRSALIFCYLGVFRTFPNFWEIPILKLSHKTEKLGGHATLERTLRLPRLIFFFEAR